MSIPNMKALHSVLLDHLLIKVLHRYPLLLLSCFAPPVSVTYFCSFLFNVHSETIKSKRKKTSRKKKQVKSNVRKTKRNKKSRKALHKYQLLTFVVFRSRIDKKQ